MDKALNNKSLAFGIPGILLQIGGNIIASSTESPFIALAGLAAVLIGTIMLIIGLALYAKAKGYAGWWGLLGLLSCLGLIVLAVLPDRLK